MTVRGLSFAYGERTILRDVTCDIPAGRLTAVVGPNGSGKTTFVSHLAGIFKPPEARVDGVRLRRARRWPAGPIHGWSGSSSRIRSTSF